MVRYTVGTSTWGNPVHGPFVSRLLIQVCGQWFVVVSGIPTRGGYTTVPSDNRYSVMVKGSVRESVDDEDRRPLLKTNLNRDLKNE